MSLGSPGQFVVRDVTDINHGVTVANLGGQVDYASRLLNATELSTTNGGQGLVRMPFSGSPRTVVAACGAIPFGWSPDGTLAAYVSGPGWPDPSSVHLVAGGVDRVIDSVPAVPPMGCESQGCADTWQFRMLFSPDGSYFSLLETQPGTLRAWSASGARALTADGAAATMQEWSGSTLYWRDSKGVEAWRAGSTSLVIPGAVWIRPHASPAGGQIVYETREPNTGTAHVVLFDTATAQTRDVASSRTDPAFLNSRYLWYRGERPCQPADNCYLGPMTWNGKTYVYDLRTGSEYESIILSVWDVWPHGA